MEAMAGNYKDSTISEIGEEMLRQLAPLNYIPDSVRELYNEAFVREFRKYLGQPVELEKYPESMRVVVLGPGCAQCDRMENDVREVMAELKLAVALDHVTDIKEIARYGVMGVPALIINDKVICVGQAPNRKKIREWLMEAMKTA